LLQKRGVGSVAPLLPSCGEVGIPGGTGGPGLAEDVAAVRQVLQDGDEPTIVVAHSYGGIVTAEAAVGIGTVGHLLLISSYLPEVGQSLSEFGGDEPAPFLAVDPDTAPSAPVPTSPNRRSYRTPTPTPSPRRSRG
jgi:pimeloyl-ACP methyl ester carboxylesterase